MSSRYLTRMGGCQDSFPCIRHQATGPICNSLFSYTFTFRNRMFHDDVIRWKKIPRYWPFVRGIQRSAVNYPHKGQWRGSLMFSLICARINCWVNNREAGDLRCHRAHYDVTVMQWTNLLKSHEWHFINTLGVFCVAKTLAMKNMFPRRYC